MELNQLRYFLEVARQQTFTAAAHELGLTQPALSRAVARLEQELGQPLFERQTRRVVLSDAGRQFQPRAQQILTLVEDARAEVTDDGRTGRVRVGAIPTVAPYFLPNLLRQFRDRHPAAQIIACEETTDRLLQRIRDGELDLAILAQPVTAPYLAVEPLFEEELLLVLPKGHPYARRSRLTLADLRDTPFILLDETHCLSGTVVALCRQRAFQPVSIERTSQLATVNELVALGHGISLIPQMARTADASRLRCYRSLTAPRPTRTLVLVSNPDRFHSRLVQQFRQEVLSATPP